MADENPINPSFKSILAQFAPQQETRGAASGLAANTVQITPGGATFQTIGAAIASITDNKLQKQYLLSIGPGTYNEQVTLKPYVYLQGSGQGQTIVTFPPAADVYARGTIIGSSNSGIGDMTVSSLGGTWGGNSTALVIAGCVPFYADNAQLISDDGGNAGINSETVAVNWNFQPLGQQSQVYISYCTITSNMQNGQSVAVALMVNGPSNVQLIECKVVATGGMQSMGALSNGGAVLTLDDCYAQGASFALNIPDYSSTLIANNCQINGPVGNGVQINNNQSSTVAGK
jgi:pectin methylesterase-like acyl-CoA thioesterase